MRPFAAENNLLDLTDIDALIVCLGGELDSIARPGASPRRIAKRPASHRPRSIQ
jgi:hypothetical protein